MSSSNGRTPPQRTTPIFPPHDWLSLATGILGGLMMVLLLLPLIALGWRVLTVSSAARSLDAQPILAALWLSLGTTSVTIGLIVLLGTPLAFAFAHYSFPFKRVLTIFVEMPIVMPPVVAGLALLAAFGRRGLVGAPLAEMGINIPFTWTAVVIVQLFVSAPFYIRAAQSRFGALPHDLEEAAGIDGANDWHTFWHITLPLSYRALLAGLTLSWSRALGEFGATILFAGNLQQRTQTMPLLVYGALEQDLNATYVTAFILLGMAAIALFATRWLSKLDEQGADPLADL